MLNNRCSWALVLFALCFAPAMAFCQVCNYSSPEDQLEPSSTTPPFSIDGLELDFARSMAMTPYRASKMTDCSNALLDCFVSEPLELSIPKKQPQVGDEWSYRGLSYRREKNISIRRLGDETTFGVISQSNNRWKTYFLLSPSHYLVGVFFAGSNGIQSRQIWLKEQKCLPFKGKEWKND